MMALKLEIKEQISILRETKEDLEAAVDQVESITWMHGNDPEPY